MIPGPWYQDLRGHTSGIAWHDCMEPSVLGPQLGYLLIPLPLLADDWAL